jgi:peptide deformylase
VAEGGQGPNGETLKEVCDNMFETMYDDKGIGLSATQVGIDLRIFVMDTKFEDEGICDAFINPVIVEASEEKVVFPEGCLSFPDMFINLERAARIKLEYSDLTFERKTVILEGISAVCAQHEFDHLNGVVFFDYLKPAKRQMAEKKLRRQIKKKRKGKL